MKKLTAMLLCVILALSLLPMGAMAAPNGYVEANVDADAEAGTVTLVITAAQVTTNGRISVAYDDACLRLAGVEIAAQVSAVSQADGSITFGYAGDDAAAIPAGQTIATIEFVALKSRETSATITVENFNQHVSVNDAQNVSFTSRVVETFTDVRYGSWYFDAVEYVAEKGYFVGVGNNLFAPNTTMTRGMFIALLHRMAGTPEATTEATFDDVSETAYYADAVAWGIENELIYGIGSNLFDPSGIVDRQQMMVFLYRYAAYLGLDVTVQGDLSAFPDGGEVSSWAVEAAIWAVSNGIVNGMDGKLNPRGIATRSQAAQLIYYFETKAQ